jgi:murein DD-endopeptidase MepM/ murein hydrolase activator NlpD
MQARLHPSSLQRPVLTLLAACLPPAFLLAAPLQALELTGEAVQGGVLFGLSSPGSQVLLDGSEVMVSADGRFVIGFDRDETGERTLRVRGLDGREESRTLAVAPREYEIERVDGLPPSTVTPDPAALERIREEAAMVSAARARRDARTDYAGGFAWPAGGRISGVYGSQRILNGEPRRPHYGLDIAAPTGSPVYAPADGVVTLVHPDMYFSGGTIVLDHGQGLSSTFLHLSRTLVEGGTSVRKGELIGEIGATGRASGPHLDWRMNWLDRRVDPQLLLKGEPLP